MSPNILLIVVDELTAEVLPSYGGQTAIAPNLSRLVQRSVVFDSAYANSPICGPSRASMMSGRLTPAVNAWDNATPLSCDVPCIPHYMSAAGYETTLIGKMHFTGPDQLHGYENRLTTDIYPADFSWTADWDLPKTAPNVAGVTMRPVLESGPCKRNMQMDYDEEIQGLAEQYIWDRARDRDTARPFFLTVSYTHPHPPFDAPQDYWDLYEDVDIPMPTVGPISTDDMDPASLMLHYNQGRNKAPVPEDCVRAARRAYFGMVTWIDAKIGALLATLEDAGLSEDTIVVFTSDHGEMLGERGMWFKMCMFEWSVRVPLFISWPRRFTPRRVAENVSLIDLLPTFHELATGTPDEPVPFEDDLDGTSLVPLMRDGSVADWPDLAISDFTASGAPAPVRMVRHGPWKLIRIGTIANQLFNIEEDVNEVQDLSSEPEMQDILQELLRLSEKDGYAPADIERQVRKSQKQRRFIHAAMTSSGRKTAWNWKVRADDDQRFVRGGGPVHGEDPTKARARLPRATKIVSTVANPPAHSRETS